MGEQTAIEWCDHTWSPWWGCQRVSPGCEHCYAETFAKRVGHGKRLPMIWGPQATAERKFFGDAHWAEPLKWNAKAARDGVRRRVFCASMADVFEDRADLVEPRTRVFALMAMTPWLDWLVLTKRPEHMARWVGEAANAHRVEKEIDRWSVALAVEDMGQEERRPIAEYPGYFVSDRGRVFTSGGAEVCGFCGNHVNGTSKRKFCSRKCTSDAAYARKRGRFVDSPSMRPMNGDAGDSGHIRVTLQRDGVAYRELVHRLVLAVFARPALPGEQGCHRDGDPTNNALPNLRWGTQSDNWEDRKRHGNGRSYAKLVDENVVDIRRSTESVAILASRFGVSDTQIRNIRDGTQWASDGIQWPPINFWAGTTVEDQKRAEERIPELLKLPARVRFLSCEPLLESVILPQWALTTVSEITHFEAFTEEAKRSYLVQPTRLIAHGIDWIIVVGESGPGARPFDFAWARSLREQCAVAGVPCFVKQVGSAPHGEWLQGEPPKATVHDTRSGSTWIEENRFKNGRWRLRDNKGGSMSEWPTDLRVRQWPEVRT